MTIDLILRVEISEISHLIIENLEIKFLYKQENNQKEFSLNLMMKLFIINLSTTITT